MLMKIKKMIHIMACSKEDTGQPEYLHSLIICFCCMLTESLVYVENVRHREALNHTLQILQVLFAEGHADLCLSSLHTSLIYLYWCIFVRVQYRVL